MVRNGNAVSIGAWSASLVSEVLTGILDEAGRAAHSAARRSPRQPARRSEIWMNFNESEAPLPDGTTLGAGRLPDQELANGAAPPSTVGIGRSGNRSW